MIELQDTDLLGGFDDISFDTDDDLIQIVQLLKELNEAEYEFVMRNTFRLKNKGG